MNCQNFTAEDEQTLRDSLKRCSAETIEKAVEYRKTGNVDLLGDVVIGIISRFIEADMREKLASAPDSAVLTEDLGLDSLTMVEIVLCVEDALGTKIENDEVQNLHTLGDIKNFIKDKAQQS